MYMMKHAFLFMMILLLGLTVRAQDISVSGTVTSKTDGLPLPGVAVVVKGTVTGTVTDINGKYSLNVPENAVLVFSFMSMETQEIEMKNRKVINVVMQDVAYDLGEVVVVGYTSESSKLVSSSLSSVNVENLQSMPTKTIDGVLQGQSPGLLINQNSGTPGAAMSVRIRGNSSINAGNQPLFVIDGIPVTTGNFGTVSMGGQGINALSDLNPNDIESITVLKDASATAIYGARGANGVILITTKRGAQNKSSLNVSMSYGLQMLPAERKLQLLNAEQWNEYKGLTGTPEHNTDWLDEIFRIAPTSNLEVSAGGGNEKTRYFISGTYYKQDGIILGTSYERYSGRLNLDHKISDKLSIGSSISLSYSENDRVEGDQTLYGVLPNAISIPAIFPVYNEDGSYNEDHFYANPVAVANEAINQAFTYRTLGNIFAEYKILSNLTFSTKWSADIYNLREHSYDPITTRQGARYNGLGIEANANVSNVVANNLLNYKKTLLQNHNIDVLLGQSFEKYRSRSSYIEAIDFPNPNLQYIASAGQIRTAETRATDRGLNSYFSQIRYNYSYKYIVGLTARFDGSSKFGANNKYGFFPALSLAWRASEEPFMKKYKNITELKVKGGVGLTGNDGIGDFASIALFGGGANYGGESGIYPIQLENPDLRWETTRQVSAGFEIGLFKDIVYLSTDFYHNKTSDLLFYRPLPPSSGYGSIAENVGMIENKGLEIDLTTLNVDRNWKWKTGFNFSLNRNKVLELHQGEEITAGRGNNLIREGEPLGVFYGLNYLGVDPSTGNLVYEDVNGDGVINSEDYVITGNPNPKFMGGMLNTFTYSKFSLSFFLQFVYGNDIYNGTRLFTEVSPTEDNQLVSVLDRWTEPGDETDIPRIGDGQRWTSRFIEDGSFLRIKHITLNYHLGGFSKAGISQARVYFSVQNAFTFTQYSGMDPDINYAGESTVVMGTDFFTYPSARTFTLGISLGF
jgi:TonB-dependent starch-binding outer membrane protein SusC